MWTVKIQYITEGLFKTQGKTEVLEKCLEDIHRATNCGLKGFSHDLQLTELYSSQINNKINSKLRKKTGKCHLLVK